MPETFSYECLHSLGLMQHVKTPILKVCSIDVLGMYILIILTSSLNAEMKNKPHALSENVGKMKKKPIYFWMRFQYPTKTVRFNHAVPIRIVSPINTKSMQSSKMLHEEHFYIAARRPNQLCLHKKICAHFAVVVKQRIIISVPLFKTSSNLTIVALSAQ